MPENKPGNIYRMSYPEIAREYPAAEEWFDDPDHTTAQVLEGRRLLSADEKVRSIRGIQKIQKRLDDLLESRDVTPIILEACAIDPMITAEIDRYAESLGRNLFIGELYYGVVDLLAPKKGQESAPLSVVRNVTYIARLPYSFKNYAVSLGNKGFMTSDEGHEMLKDYFHRQRRNY